MEDLDDDVELEEPIEPVEVTRGPRPGSSRDFPIDIDDPKAAFRIGGGHRTPVPARDLITTCDIELPGTMWLKDKGGKLHRAAYMSHSRLTTYAKCHRMYHFKYVKGIPDVRPAVKLWTGSGYHNVMEEAMQAKIDGKPYSLEQARKRFRQHMVEEFKKFDEDSATEIKLGRDPIELKLPERLESREDLVRLGEDMVEVFLKTEAPKIKPLAVEKRVTYNMSLNNRPGSLAFVGYVDLIEEDVDGPRIIDYKTGRLRTQENLQMDQQLTLYALAENIFNAGWFSVKMGTTGGKTPKRAKPAEIVKLKKKVTIKDQEVLHEDFNAYLEGMAAGNYARTGLMNSQICSSKLCPYWHQCLGKGKVDD